MSSSPSLRDRGTSGEVRLAAEALRWAFDFYRRHLALVVGISLVPSAQRAVAQLWGSQLPGAVNVALEIVTAVARVVLFVLVLRLAILTEDRLRDVDVGESFRRMSAFARHHWRSLLLQGLLLLAAFTVFGLIPDFVIAPRIPDHAQPTYWAVLLAVKNPTIIAFTIIWEIGVVRQMLLHDAGAPQPDNESTPVGI